MISDTPARRTGRPTLDEAATLQERILDETLHMVASSGSEGFSVDQLAARISVTKRTIYRHYKNKNGLILTAVAREIDALLEQSEVAPETVEARAIAQLRVYIKTLFDYIYTPRAIAFLKFLMFEAESNVEISAQLSKWHDHVMNRACHLISESQNVGLIRQGNPRRFALLLFDLTTSVQSRTKPWAGMTEIFGGDDPEQYFEFRWLGFLSLVSDNPWANFISLAHNEKPSNPVI